MDVSHFDLNLLRSLDILLQERNVTRAGERLFVSQQAASSALARLRTHFDDDLLVRVGRHLELTPLAESLVKPVREALLYAQAALDARPLFNTATVRRVCRIAMTDYSILVVLPRIVRRLASVAKGIRCVVEPVTRDSFERLEMGHLDFCLTAHDWRLYGDRRPGPNIRDKAMFRDDFVCVVDDALFPPGEHLTLERYAKMSHCSVEFGQGVATLVERAWAASGFDFSVSITLPSFSSLLMILPGTQLVATTQRRLATTLAPNLGLRILDCPLEVAVLQENLLWHERNETDPASRFMRGLFADAAAELDAPAKMGQVQPLSVG